MTKLADGIHPAVDRDHYDLIERVNLSTLKVIDQSPAHYQHVLTTPVEDTDPMRVGRVTHVACFEPERFRSLVVEWTGKVRNGGKWDDFRHENRGREILTSNQLARVTAIQKAVRADAIALKYTSGGRGEVTMLWTLNRGSGVNAYTVQCKGRIDFDGKLGLVDLKTTADASPEGFGRQAASLNYDVQAAWYSDAYALLSGKRKPYFIVAAESEAPWVVQVYEVPDAVMQRGREKYSLWLDRLAMCRETSTWPAYADDVLELELPHWLMPDPDEDLSRLGLVIGGKTHGQGLPIEND